MGGASMRILMITIILSLVKGKPMQPDLEPTDICLFTCEYCYQGEILIRCANECLMRDGIMHHDWLKTCPYFGLPLYFEK